MKDQTRRQIEEVVDDTRQQLLAHVRDEGRIAVVKGAAWLGEDPSADAMRPGRQEETRGDRDTDSISGRRHLPAARAGFQRCADSLCGRFVRSTTGVIRDRHGEKRASGQGVRGRWGKTSCGETANGWLSAVRRKTLD